MLRDIFYPLSLLLCFFVNLSRETNLQTSINNSNCNPELHVQDLFLQMDPIKIKVNKIQSREKPSYQLNVTRVNGD